MRANARATFSQNFLFFFIFFGRKFFLGDLVVGSIIYFKAILRRFLALLYIK